MTADKRDIDKLLTLVRKWHREQDPEKSSEYFRQAWDLSLDLGNAAGLSHVDKVAGNTFFYCARLVAEKQWNNQQMYILLDREGIQVEGWDYR